MLPVQRKGAYNTASQAVAVHIVQRIYTYPSPLSVFQHWPVAASPVSQASCKTHCRPVDAIELHARRQRALV
ncbi:hypothetical protein J3E69DRAFT_331633, partial [Trichoderma sp. SZMC 28015]